MPRDSQTNMVPQQEQQPEDARSRRLWRRRLRVVQLLVLGVFCAVAVRLTEIQIINPGPYLIVAENQYKYRDTLPAARGMIFDRNGDVIGSNSMDASVAIDPRHIGGDSTAIVRTMSRITKKSPAHYRSKIRKKRGFVWLKRHLPPQVALDYGLDTLNGVEIVQEPRRIYHVGNIAGQLIGTTDPDNTGIAGLELQYDSLLAGTPGWIEYALDGHHNEWASVDYPRREPIAGNNVHLTIDLWLQELAERELEKGVKEREAEGGIVLMMDPRTGEVLAMAQYPRVGPASYGKSPKAHQKLRAVTDMFEPGSVFKLVTASAALQDKLIPPEKMFYAENGIYTVRNGKGRKTRTIRDVHKNGWITFRQGFIESSNIVMAKASDIIGNERLYRMARAYGFGMATNIDVPGEISGRMANPVRWSGVSRHSFSFGYEVGVTPVQIAAAFAAVANGGSLMRPYLVRKIEDGEGNIILENGPQKVRRVVSAETAAELTSFLEGVVERGTATSAIVEGLRIAGKTGTSKRVVDGKYAGKDYTASFVGYFPADDPKMLCLVMLDNPRGINYYGGTTSAPIFREIVEYIVTTTDRYGVPVTGAIAETEHPVKTRRAPAAGPGPVHGNPAGLKADDADNALFVPDVRGFSIRKAVGILTEEKFRTEIKGSGVVVSQKPEPGKPFRTGMVVTLDCEPRAGENDGTR